MLHQGKQGHCGYPVNESNKVICRRILLLYQDFLGFELSDLSNHGHCNSLE